MRSLFIVLGLFVSTTLFAQDFNMNININVDEDEVEMNMGVQEDGANMNVDIQHNTTEEHHHSHTETHEVHYEEPVSYTPSAPACPTLDDSEFSEFISSLKEKSFEDSKMSMAKQMLKHNCVYAVQVKKIMQAFSFEDSRLEFAIKAYEKTVDQNKYYQVHGAFDFEMSIEELNESIE